MVILRCTVFLAFSSWKLKNAAIFSRIRLVFYIFYWKERGLFFPLLLRHFWPWSTEALCLQLSHMRKTMRNKIFISRQIRNFPPLMWTMTNVEISKHRVWLDCLDQSLPIPRPLNSSCGLLNSDYGKSSHHRCDNWPKSVFVLQWLWISDYFRLHWGT